MKTNPSISVWFDKTSDVHGYIVSLDDSQTSTTLHVFPRSKQRAIVCAKREARNRKLPLVIEEAQ